jgi:hypothetical protein
VRDLLYIGIEGEGEKWRQFKCSSATQWNFLPYLLAVFIVLEVLYTTRIYVYTRKCV